MTWRRAAPAALVLTAAAILLVGGCSRRQPLQPFAQSSGHVWTVGPPGPPPIASGRYSADSVSSGVDGLLGFPILRWSYASARSRTHPLLRYLLARGLTDTTRVALVVGFRDRTPIIRLPIERLAPERDSATIAGGRVTVDSLLDSLRADRARWYPVQEDRLRTLYGAVIGRRFELTQAVVARVPKNRVRALAHWSEVTSIRPLQVRAKPPQPPGTPPPTSVQGAASRMGLPPYQAAGLTTWRMRMLDTGVDATHSWLSPLPHADVPGSPGPVLVPYDCITAAVCAGTYPYDCDLTGHGTPSAAILVARGNAQADSRGVTDARVHACRVWWRDGGGYMWHDADAVEAGLSAAYAAPASVSVVEVCDAEGPNGVYAGSANGAYSQGVVVLAPIGNTNAAIPGDPFSGAQSPGSARGVLGVGARESGNPALDLAGQGYGGVKDRSKPDLQALTSTSTAKRGTGVMTFSGTSGAAPYAGAAALAAREFLTVAAGTVDPPQVYAGLVACGDEVRAGTGPFPDVRGAGLVTLPVRSSCWFGSRKMKNGARRDFHIRVTDPTVRALHVGLWWKDPERKLLPLGVVLERHYDFDLELLDPTGAIVATSGGAFGVFERITYPPPGSPIPPAGLVGRWRVRIRARHTAWSGSRVYWTAFAAR